MARKRSNPARRTGRGQEVDGIVRDADGNNDWLSSPSIETPPPRRVDGQLERKLKTKLPGGAWGHSH